MAGPSKAKVHASVGRAIDQALESMARAAEETRRGAVHEENRSEGDKDMRATEQSYVARGQAMRTEELAEQAARFRQWVFREHEDEPIRPGSLVHATVDGSSRWVYVFALGAGFEVDVDGTRVAVLSPASPAGRALLGKETGDVAVVEAAGRKREWEIESVR